MNAVLVLNCPTGVASSTDAAKAVIAVVQAQPHPPLIASWVGDSPTVEEARRQFATNRVPVYDTPDQAVLAFMHLVRYRESRRALIETPPSVPEEFVPDVADARPLIVLASGRDWLTEPEAKQLLSAYASRWRRPARSSMSPRRWRRPMRSAFPWR